MTDSFRISVVIPTYRRCESVQRLLQALAKQTIAPEDYQVIVSIDGSDDGTREMVERFAAPYSLQVLWHPHQGRASACNAGIRTASGELIVLLDDDMEPVPDFLAAHWRGHLADSQLGLLGAVPIRVNATSSPVTRYIADRFNRHMADLALPDHQFKLRDFYSGNFSIRRDVLVCAGLFDAAFEMYGNEDLELFLRLSKQNVRFIFCPETLAYQHYEKTFAALAQDNLAKGETVILLAQKHPDVTFNTKLGTYRQFSFKWRMLRAVLVQSSQIVSAMPDWIIRLVMQVEKLQSSQWQMVYYFVLDYFFWLGVSRALKSHPDDRLRASIKDFQKSSSQ